MAGKLFGDLYNELILTQPDLKEKELPGSVCPGESEVVESLFGWNVIVNGKTIECDSEPEARFVRIFTEIGWQNILIPSDEKYLSKILPEFEAMKDRVDELYKKREKTIFSRKLRKEVKLKFYRNTGRTVADYRAEKPRPHHEAR